MQRMLCVRVCHCIATIREIVLQEEQIASLIAENDRLKVSVCAFVFAMCIRGYLLVWDHILS